MRKANLIILITMTALACIELTGPRRDEIACIEVAKPSLTVQANKPLPNAIKLKVNGKVIMDECADVTRSLASNIDAEKHGHEVVVYGQNELQSPLALEINDCRRKTVLFSGSLDPQFLAPLPSTCQQGKKSIRPALVTIKM